MISFEEFGMIGLATAITMLVIVVGIGIIRYILRIDEIVELLKSIDKSLHDANIER